MTAVTALTALAGGVGALARVEWSAHAAARWPGAAWGTRGVNLAGTVALLALLVVGPDAPLVRVLGTGFLGGFTTFSTWMADAHGRGGRGRALEVAWLVVPAVAAAFAVAVGTHGGVA